MQNVNLVLKARILATAENHFFVDSTHYFDLQANPCPNNAQIIVFIFYLN